MKAFALFLSFSLCITAFGYSQKKGEEVKIQATDYTPLVKSLESTIGTLYLVISGDKKEKRDWDLFYFLFAPEAQLITTGVNFENKMQAKYMTPKDYVKASKNWMLKNGFHEREIHRIVHNYGAITQVFSTFEAYHSTKDKSPFSKGINSIQLMNDGNRWWILNLAWTNESPENPIPEEYLPQDDDF
ncbi:hypothetical protein [Formosa sp. A9]|uniref:hypothetical protein n=1 Tax=Formosa sp. A9 TaxID=3442641 RepID=UPI003EB8A678